MARKTYINTESGIAMVIALVMLLALTVIGISSLLNSTLDIQMSGNERRSEESLALADAGVERVVHDLLYDFKRDDALSWVNNDTMTTVSLADGTTEVGYSLGTPTGNFDCTPQPDCIGDQFGDPYAVANIAGSNIGNAVDPYTGTEPAETLGEGRYRVLVLRDPGEPDEIYVRSYAETSTGARKVVQVHMKVKTIDVWRNAVFGGRGSASATITGNINVAGSVHVLGTGAVNLYTISGTAGVYNGYKDMGQTGPYSYSELKSKVLYDIDGVGGYDNLDSYVDSGGHRVYSLDSEFRVKNVQVNLASGSATIGEDYDSLQYDSDLYWKGRMDGIYANRAITGSSNYYSDNKESDGSVPVYDLGDKIQMPSFEDEYVSPDGTLYTTYKNYIETKSYTLPNTVCNLIHSTTGSGIWGDANSDGVCTDADVAMSGTGCLKWTNGTSGSSTKADPDKIQIAGRVKFDSSCSNSEFTVGEGGGNIEYSGKGLLYGSKSLHMLGSLVTTSSGNYIKDNLIGLLSTGNIRISAAGDPNATIMAGMFSAGLISTENPGAIIGTMVSNEFCMGGTKIDASSGDRVCKTGGQASDIFYVPKMSEEISKLGMIRGNQIFAFSSYEWEEVF